MFKTITALLGLSFCCSIPFTLLASQSLILCPSAAKTEAVKKNSLEFVYCGAASCKIMRGNKKAKCKNCKIMRGENAGTKTCAQRAAKNIGTRTVYTSSFTLRKTIEPGVERWPLVVCDTKTGNADSKYADCLNARCSKDKSGDFVCICKVEESKNKWVGQVEKCTDKSITEACISGDPNHIVNGAPYAPLAPLIKKLQQAKDGNRLICNTTDSAP